MAASYGEGNPRDKNIYIYEEIMAENISNQINLQMQTQQTQSRINTK